MTSCTWHVSRFKHDFEEKMAEQMRKERAEATHRARAAAWEAEKADAQASRVRSPPIWTLCGVSARQGAQYTTDPCCSAYAASPCLLCFTGHRNLQEGVESVRALRRSWSRCPDSPRSLQERSDRQRWRTRIPEAACVRGISHVGGTCKEVGSRAHHDGLSYPAAGEV